MAASFPVDHDLVLQLKRELKRRELDLALLREITTLIGGEFDLQTVFDRVALRARELIDAGTVLIPILTPEQDSYTYRAAEGENADELRGESLPIDIGVCGWVLRHQRPWWQGMLSELSENERNDWEKEAGTLILVPLIGKHRFLGGIAALNKAGEEEFSERDMELLTLFAGQVAIALESAIAFSELNEANTRAEALRRKLQNTNEKLVDANKELQHMAVHDPLTGLPNRTLIMDRLYQGIRGSKRGHEELALIMIDLDHFKEVNDTLGHPVGDELLIRISKRFKEALREMDTLGRLGGDEFAIVTSAHDAESAICVAEKLQEALHEPITIKGMNFSIGASMGIALYPEHGVTPSSLLKSADVAMYVAKRNKEDCCVYDEYADEHDPMRLTLPGDLRMAIQNREVEIAVQPKLNLSTGMIVGAEALARWTHPEKGPISPVEFIPILEKIGLIKPFTLQILERSIKECARWRAEGYGISVAVNLTMDNLRDPNLPGQVDELLQRYQLEHRKLILEITESVIMTDPEFTMGILTQLHDMGVRLSIDDFGTGYSSLSYLKRLPVHQLKIDRSFVHNITHDSDDSTIVRSTVDLAHNLGLAVVAEGVETQDVYHAIRGTGCEIAQGYYISRPLEPEDFMKFLKAAPWPAKPIKVASNG